MLILIALLLLITAVGGCGCDPEEEERAREERVDNKFEGAQERLQEERAAQEEADRKEFERQFGYSYGWYDHPDGSIYLNRDGTYKTINDAGNSTSGTYTVSGNAIYFHQTAPEAVEGTATIEYGVITNAYGRFVKRQE